MRIAPGLSVPCQTSGSGLTKPPCRETLVQTMRLFSRILILLGLAATNGPGEISPSHFKELTALCTPGKSTSGWLELGWEIDLWKARQLAAATGKPIFLWEMDGHPLGCT